MSCIADFDVSGIADILTVDYGESSAVHDRHYTK